MQATLERPGRSRTGDVPLVLDGEMQLTARQLHDVAVRRHPVSIAPVVKHRLAAARSYLARLTGERRRIYGVTTGYGPLATSYVSPDLGRLLQRNLVYHLAAGVGAPLGEAMVRGMMLARLNVLLRGHSAVEMRVVDTLAEWLNSGLTPYVPAKGTVGASGDLTPLAHMAWALMGEGECLVDGQPIKATALLAETGIQPLELDHKDGISLVNGTSAMTAIAALNSVRFRNLLQFAMQTSLLHAEIMGGQREAWHPALAAVRPHPGQGWVTEQLWRWSAESRRLIDHATVPPRLADVVRHGSTDEDGGFRVAAGQTLHQDIYSIRCVPQLLGAIADLARQHDQTVEIELNAVTDNPLIFAPESEDDDGMLIHGGNFQGQPVSFASDQLMMAAIKTAILAERQIARLTHPELNRRLPAFLQPHETGLDSGFMGAQVSASALVAEMRTRAVPASIQSIPTNGDNQDVVSMGTIAARRTSELLDDLESLLAIQALALAQAVDLENAVDDDSLATPSRKLYRAVRAAADRLHRDRPLAPDIEAVRNAFKSRPGDFLSD